MARIRSIKPAFFRHRELFLLEQSSGLPVRVGFAGLWTVADREGRFRWKPVELKLDCLPYDDVDFAEVLAALESADFVQKYTIDGKEYGVVPSWIDHQVISTREAQSVLPQPPGSVITSNCNGEGKGREGKGKGKGIEISSEPHAASEPEDASPVLLEFPTVGTSGSTWRLRRRQADEWQGLFPALDVTAEARKALAWVNAHPDRRKTPRGMPKFLVSWLTRSSDRGSPSRAVVPFTKTAGNAASGHRFIARGQS